MLEPMKMPWRLMRFVMAVSLCQLFAVAPVHSEDWPGWRGPRGDGTSHETNVPVRWDAATGENIAWKIAVPGMGHSCPIVTGDQLLLTTFVSETNERLLICYDAETGAEEWRTVVFSGPQETMHSLNSSASSTPVTDGTSVFVTFLQVDGRTVPAPNVGTPREITPGEIVVASHSLAGEKQWMVKVGEFVSAHGFASSPVLFEDLLIVNGDHDGSSYITALHKSNGETVWKVPREHGIRSYCTPLLRETDSRTQLVFSGSNSIVSLDPRDGSEHWSIDGPTEQFVASMVDDGERFFMAAGFPTHHVMAVRRDGSGDVTDSHVVWHVTNAKCYVPSPVTTDGYLLVADDRGTANCFDATTGERLWQARLGRHFSPSLVTAGGLVYFLADDGTTKVVTPGPEVNIVAENELGERCSASPAIANGRLYIRTHEHLFAIGENKE